MKLQCYVCKYVTATEFLFQDFFYTCMSHLSDRGFASPVIDPKVEAEKKRQEALAKEKEAVIKEYEEKTKQSKWFWQKDEKKDKESKAKAAEEEKDQKVRPPSSFFMHSENSSLDFRELFLQCRIRTNVSPLLA